jgi:DNA-binding beta-propeller fold protein YncE
VQSPQYCPALCNDIAVAKDGTVYAADTTQGRVRRLRKGANADRPRQGRNQNTEEGLPGITAVTLAGKTAYVAEAKLNLRNDASKDPGPFRAIGVPYSAPK